MANENYFTLFKSIICDEYRPKLYYEVPEFQRPYSWGKNEANLLFDDLFENDEHYFLGSIITIAPPSQLQKQIISSRIIDGQQRMTTLFLLLTAIFDKIITDSSLYSQIKEIDKYNKDYLVLRTALAFLDDFEDDPTKNTIGEIKLKLQDINDIDLKYIVYSVLKKDINLLIDNNNASILTSPPSNLGNRRISIIFNFLGKKIESFDLKQIMRLLHNILFSSLVLIEVKDENQAFTMFESLNNRGLPLTPIDLIKSAMIQITSTDIIKKNNCNQKWKEMTNNLGEDPSVHERFLRHFYDVYKTQNRKDSVLDSLTSKAERSKLIELYKKWFHITTIYSLINDMYKASIPYRKLSQEILEGDNKSEKYELDFIRVKGAPGCILLLYLVNEKEQLKLDNNSIKKIFRIVTSFFVIRHLIEKPATSALDDIFIRIVTYIQENISNVDENNPAPQQEIIDYVKDKLKEEFVKSLKIESSNKEDINNELKEEIKKALQGNIYLDNKPLARFLLCSFNANDTEGTDYWEKKKNGKDYKYTIEHVFPEGDNIPDCWVNEIANGNKELAKNHQDRYCHTLGNLTLTAFNSKLSNHSFSEKQNYMESNNHIGYKNGLYINGNFGSSDNEDINLSATDHWSIDQIKKRTTVMSQRIIEKFFF